MGVEVVTRETTRHYKKLHPSRDYHEHFKLHKVVKQISYLYFIV